MYCTKEEKIKYANIGAKFMLESVIEVLEEDGVGTGEEVLMMLKGTLAVHLDLMEENDEY